MTNAAIAARANEAKKLTDKDLLSAVLGGDQVAWAELLARFDTTIKKRIKFVVGRCWTKYRSSDLFEEIRAELYLKLIERDMARLRASDPERGTLTNWISLIATRTALDHLEKLMRRETTMTIDELVDHENSDAQRGANWIAKGV